MELAGQALGFLGSREPRLHVRAARRRLGRPRRLLADDAEADLDAAAHLGERLAQGRGATADRLVEGALVAEPAPEARREQRGASADERLDDPRVREHRLLRRLERRALVLAHDEIEPVHLPPGEGRVLDSPHVGQLVELLGNRVQVDHRDDSASASSRSSVPTDASSTRRPT